MKTENHDELPESLCFEVDGHVSDVVVTCLADGEIAILPAAALAHVDACHACTARLGTEALLSVNATDALRAAASEARAPLRIVTAAPALPAPGRAAGRDAVWSAPTPSSSARKRRPLPIGAIAAALCVAALGMMPGWSDTLHNLRTVVPDYLHALPIWSHALEAVLRSLLQSRSGVALRWMIAAVFIAAGSLLARSMTRKQALERGL
jgi:hypothetical protein